MKIISLNANGIRSAFRKGFPQWMQAVNPDFVCLQETKAQLANLNLQDFQLPGYHFYFSDAVKPGYSGVAIYSKYRPTKVVERLGFPLSDEEGRYIQLDFPKFSIASLYLPSGSSGELRQTKKYEFMYTYEKKLSKNKSNLIVCGDWNIVHKEIDIKNFKGNQKNSGCLPEERAWMDKVFTTLGLVDGFRVVNSKSEEYTWWSNRGQARAKNVGWRIDYQVITPELAKVVKDAYIFKDEWFSDHAPVVMTYDMKIEV